MDEVGVRLGFAGLRIVRSDLGRCTEQLVCDVPPRISLRKLFTDPQAKHTELNRSLIKM